MAKTALKRCLAKRYKKQSYKINKYAKHVLQHTIIKYFFVYLWCYCHPLKITS